MRDVTLIAPRATGRTVTSRRWPSGSFVSTSSTVPPPAGRAALNRVAWNHTVGDSAAT